MARKTAKRARTGRRKMRGGGKTYCCKSTGECTPSWTGSCVGYSANTGDKKYKCEPDITATVASMDASSTCSPAALEDSTTVLQNNAASGLTTLGNVGKGVGQGAVAVGQGLGRGLYNGVGNFATALAQNALRQAGKRKTKKNKSKRSKK